MKKPLRSRSLSGTIDLTKAEIDNALPRLSKGLKQYLWLQANRDAVEARSNSLYRRRFNNFYRVRRGKEWQDKFYELLEGKKGKQVDFADVLNELYTTTGRYEASFASKLLATLDPHMPVIDSIVLGNLNLKLPAFNCQDRTVRICKVHDSLLSRFKYFLASDNGTYLIQRFRCTYPEADITTIKMLDLVLWQTRPTATPQPTSTTARETE